MEKSEDLQSVARDYFSSLFQHRDSLSAPVIEAILPKISPDNNDMLLSPFFQEEFCVAFFQMDPDKCPGLDRISPGFFQHFWELCGPDIYSSCCNWMETGMIPESLNDTNIALIRKCDNPKTM